MTNGTRELAEEIFQMSVKIGMPMGFGAGLVKEVESPVFSTAVGLVLYAFKHHETSNLMSFIQETEQIGDVLEPTAADAFDGDDAERQRGSIFSRMKEWFDQL
jgi:cell division ATPase FtsA